MITSLILSYTWVAIIPGLLVGAVLCYIYVPIVGHIMAIALVACAAALGAYELGYADRGKLDQSAALNEIIKERDAVIEQQKVDAKHNKEIQESVADRARKAEKLTDDLQSKVDDYEKQLKDSADAAGQPEVQTVIVHDGQTCPPIPKPTNTCLLTSGDVSRLRAIAGNRDSGSAEPASRAGRLRPAH